MTIAFQQKIGIAKQLNQILYLKNLNCFNFLNSIIINPINAKIYDKLKH